MENKTTKQNTPVNIVTALSYTNMMQDPVQTCTVNFISASDKANFLLKLLFTQRDKCYK